jgi:CheY-like chemotaxis protein
LLKALLEDEGHTVIWVQNRQEIPQDLSGFSVVVSDYHVPGGVFEDTVSVCQRCNVPLVLISGGVLNHPHRPFLYKPFGTEELLEVVNKVVGG